MSITGQVKTLYEDQEKTKVVLPRTNIKAISNDSGVGLEALLDERVKTSELPTKLPNPNALTINGQVYDGSKPVSVTVTAEGGEVIDTNTTYSISKSGSTITLTGSDGSTSSITDANTTYSEASQSAAGLLSANDKKKLDGIATGANNYTLPTASSSALGGVKVGNNITNSNGTISLTKDNVVAALGYTPPTTDTNTTYTLAKSGSTIQLKSGSTVVSSVTDSDTNTTYNNATTSTAGLMSVSDKSKLDSISIYCVDSGTVTSNMASQNGTITKAFTYHYFIYYSPSWNSSSRWMEIYGISDSFSYTTNAGSYQGGKEGIELYPPNWPRQFTDNPIGHAQFSTRDNVLMAEGFKFDAASPGGIYFMRGSEATCNGYIMLRASGWTTA